MRRFLRVIGGSMSGVVLLAAVLGACPCGDSAAIALPQGCCPTSLGLEPASGGCCANVTGARLTVPAGCKRAPERVVTIGSMTLSPTPPTMVGVLLVQSTLQPHRPFAQKAPAPTVPTAILRI